MVHILIIEDDLTLRGNTAELLELEGYKVTTATNGKTGLQRIKRNPPDLILCDLLMPEMDGFTLLGRIGQYSRLKRIPFIFFSAKTEKIDIRAGIDAGADDYLIKPFELDALLASIAKCLHKKQSS